MLYVATYDITPDGVQLVCVGLPRVTAGNPGLWMTTALRASTIPRDVCTCSACGVWDAIFIRVPEGYPGMTSFAQIDIPRPLRGRLLLVGRFPRGKPRGYFSLPRVRGISILNMPTF